MPRSGGRQRIIEHNAFAVDLSRSELGGETRLTIGPREGSRSLAHIDLDPSEARSLAYSLLAAAERGMDEPKQDAEWAEEYWAEGTFPTDDLREDEP